MPKILLIQLLVEIYNLNQWKMDLMEIYLEMNCDFNLMYILLYYTDFN